MATILVQSDCANRVGIYEYDRVSDRPDSTSFDVLGELGPMSIPCGDPDDPELFNLTQTKPPATFSAREIRGWSVPRNLRMSAADAL